MPRSPQFFAPLPPASEAREHFQPTCVECGRDASWGEDVHLRCGQEGTWYCAKHVPACLRYPEQSQQQEDRP